MIVPHDEANKVLAPYFQKFLQCILKANEEQNTAIIPGARAKTRKRTISGLMNDLVTHNLRSELLDSPGITIKERYGQLQIVISTGSSGFLMKTKQTNRRKPLSFIPTQLALDFVYQLEQLQLPNMPSPLTNIILTYQWNKARTDVERVSIRCPSDELNYSWEIPIPVVQVPHLVAPTEDVPGSEKRVTTKKRNVRKTKKNTKRGQDNNERKGETNKS